MHSQLNLLNGGHLIFKHPKRCQTTNFNPKKVRRLPLHFIWKYPRACYLRLGCPFYIQLDLRLFQFCSANLLCISFQDSVLKIIEPFLIGHCQRKPWVIQQHIHHTVILTRDGIIEWCVTSLVLETVNT